MSNICGKCEQICEPTEVDDGGYEEAWGAKVWVPAWSTVSDCCADDVYTLKEWITNGWTIPADADTYEYFLDEGLVEPHTNRV